MIALVQQNGINWTSTITAVVSLTTMIGFFTSWLIRRMERARSRSEQFAREQIELVSHEVYDRLDRMTASLDQHNGQIGQVAERVARLEGPVRRTVGGR